MLTQERLKELLHYDPLTGVFTWKGSSRRGWNGRIAGSIDHKGYIVINLGQVYKAHRLAWLYTYGVWPSSQLDHQDRVKSNNRLGNLVEATGQENCLNKGLLITSTSGFTGVTRNTRDTKWIARFSTKEKRHFLGEFTNIEDAVSARNLFKENQCQPT